jgi:hypothetical protein
MPMRFLPAAFAALTVLFSAASQAQAQAQTDNRAYDNQNYDNRARNRANDQESVSDKFTQNEIVQAASGFFGMTTEAVAKAVQKVFSEQGLPDAYITGEEGSGAIIVGLRYGSGWLIRKHHKARKVYWQGPSIGFDIGGNASKSFTLVYNLRSADRLFQKFPGIEGTYYFIAGIGVNYLRAGDITLAPMRTGVGLRAGVNAGYLTFTREESLNPF